MKSQSLILILCLSYVYLQAQDEQQDQDQQEQQETSLSLAFTNAIVNCESETTNQLTITGITNKNIDASEAVTVKLSNSTSLTCETDGASVTNLRNLDSSITIICTIEIEDNSEIKISKITFTEGSSGDNINLSINTANKCSSGKIEEEEEEEEEEGETDELTPQEFGNLKVKAISVSQNNVVVAITLIEDEDENKRLSDNASIKNLKLVDNGSFSQDLTCTINKGSKLSSVICTMQTAATDGSKYKLSGTDVKFESKQDKFGSVQIEDTEALAFTDDSENDTSSWLKNSIILFIYALLFSI